jgi:hypothetical protein
MHCKRCHGLVVAETLTDGSVSEKLSALGVWRCVNCGELLDAVVLRNRGERALQRTGRRVPVRSESRPRYPWLSQSVSVTDYGTLETERV